MEAWRSVWRAGLAPLLSTQSLESLRDALERDDPALLQGATTSPPPLRGVRDWPVEAACVVGYCGWRGEGLETVAEVEEFFARMCCEVDQRLGEPAGCRWFLQWFDDSPREQAVQKLLMEVETSLAEREQRSGAGREEAARESAAV